MNLAICDDEKINRKILLEHLEQIDSRNLELDITEFSCGEDLLSYYSNGKDLILYF